MNQWKSASLSEVCQVKPPKKEAKEKLADTDLVSFVPMNNLGICAKRIELKEDKALGKVSGSYTYFAEDDVLLAKITPCFENGKLGIASGLTNGIGFGSSEYIVFRSRGELVPGYLFYFLSQDSFREAGAKVMTGAVGHKRVPKEFIENQQIPLPPIPEQKRIVAILDEAFASISQAVANAEKNLTNARELFDSYLNGVFTQKGEGWDESPLEEHIRFIDYRGKTPKKTEAGLRLITAKNVRMGFLQREPEEFVAPDAYNSWMTRGIPKKGDVLFTTEAPLGLVCQLDTEDKVVFAQRIITMQPDRKIIDPTFLSFVLRSALLQSRIHDKGTGATVKGIKASLLKKIIIPLPPLVEQESIVEKLKNLSVKTQHLETTYQQKLTALAELKQSLLQKAFAGELTETGSAADPIPLPRIVTATSKKKASKEFIEAVLISQFVRAMSDDKYALGRERYNKLCYLAHRKTEDDVSQQYLKKAAGPYSPWAKYGGPEKIALDNGYIQPVKRGEYSGFVAGPYINKIDSYTGNYPVCGAVDWVVQKFRYATTDDLELLTTVDFAAMDIVEQGKTVNLQAVKSLIADNKDWAPKLKRSLFSDIGIQRALKELAELFPITLGSKINGA